VPLNLERCHCGHFADISLEEKLDRRAMLQSDGAESFLIAKRQQWRAGGKKWKLSISMKECSLIGVVESIVHSLSNGRKSSGSSGRFLPGRHRRLRAVRVDDDSVRFMQMMKS